MTKATSDSGLWIMPAPPRLPPGSANAAPAESRAKPKTGAPAGAAPQGTGANRPAIWLDGNVLTCACPDCGAPIAVRVWLMLADCWRCGTSVELTPEQQQLAQELLSRAKAASDVRPPKSPQVSSQPSPQPSPPTVPTVASPVTKAAPETAAPQTSVPVAAPPKPAGPPPLPRRTRKSNVPVAKLVKPPPSAPAPLPVAPPVVAESLSRLPWQTPEEPRGRTRWWLALATSLLLAGLALGFWLLHHKGRGVDPAAVAISTTSPTAKAPPKVVGPLSLPRDASAPALHELPKVVSAIQSMDQPRMFEGRDPRVRQAILDEEGGSLETERAVVAGLHWLAAHQEKDGHWSLDHFSRAGDCDGRCDGRGGFSDNAATALALLPFLGAAQSHKMGSYQSVVERGLKWLIARQEPNGDLRGPGMARMYAHSLSTIVLCEALAMTGDDHLLRGPATGAVEYIVRAQNPEGGWRYEPGQDGDMSVMGWQLMALQCAKGAYIDVPKRSFNRASHFLNSVRSGKHGGLFAYQPGNAPSPAMTAEGLLSREYLGWPQDHPGLTEGVQWLMRDLPNQREPNIYCWYYATQVIHNIGGEPWKKWNAAVRNALLSMQEKAGHPTGSWAPRGGAISGGYDTAIGGRIYMTSLALCTLEVYYRYLPIYRAIDVE